MIECPQRGVARRLDRSSVGVSACRGLALAGLHALISEREAAEGISPDDPDLELLLALEKGPLASSAVVEVRAGDRAGRRVGQGGRWRRRPSSLVTP